MPVKGRENEVKRNPRVGTRKARTPLPRRTVKLDFGSSTGLMAAIQRLQEAEIQASIDYRLALSTVNAELIARKKKDWLDLIEQLRKVEQSNPEIEKANAKTVPIVDVEREIARMCTAFRVKLEAIPRSMPQRLAGADEITIQQALQAEIGEALGHLHAGDWNGSAKTH